jgi:hypothetical protein
MTASLSSTPLLSSPFPFFIINRQTNELDKCRYEQATPPRNLIPCLWQGFELSHTNLNLLNSDDK